MHFKVNFMVRILLLACFAVCFGDCFAQRINQTDPVEIGGFREDVYKQNDVILDRDALGYVMRSNGFSSQLIDRADKNRGGANVLGFLGGAGVGWSLGALLGGGDFPAGIFAVGAGFLIISIPLSTAVKRNTLEAIKAHNDHVAQSESNRRQRKWQWSIGSTAGGVGLRAQF